MVASAASCVEWCASDVEFFLEAEDIVVPGILELECGDNSVSSDTSHTPDGKFAVASSVALSQQGN